MIDWSINKFLNQPFANTNKHLPALRIWTFGKTGKESGKFMRIRGMRRKIYLLTCDKKRLNQRALRIRRSFDEVRKILGKI